ncbi:MAG: hypothetical protein AB7S75_23205 [Desulfococcaceae bacterium]
MKTNLFLNPYQQPENKLTYSFLALVDFINNREFMEWLCDGYFSDNPVQQINGVLGGGNSNPDGKIIIRDRNGDNINIYIENKTNRRQLSVEQIISHLEWLNGKDKLLVITPRASDRNIVKELKNDVIVFKTWSEIAEYLRKKLQNKIAEQFIEYGKLSGEFEENGELTRSEIEVYSSYYQMNFEGKIYSIFNSLLIELYSIESEFKNIYYEYRDNWGRKGIEIYSNKEETKYGQWWAISLYYSVNDHKIKLKKQVPEIVFFFDVDPSKKDVLKNDNCFRDLVKDLLKLGFESNLNNELTPNKWRLLIYRKSITDFQNINLQELLGFVFHVFNKLKESKAIEHEYFGEFV